MLRIRLVNAIGPALLDGLGALLTDAVESGASVGFLAPLEHDTAMHYWAHTATSLGRDLRLWVAERGSDVLGSVQLSLCERENGRHRAEVQKLFVLRSARGQGIAGELMATVESYAREHGRSLLFLDTQVGSTAERVYTRLGWIKAGEIPRYAASPDGTLHTTAYFWKEIA